MANRTATIRQVKLCGLRTALPSFLVSLDEPTASDNTPDLSSKLAWDVLREHAHVLCA